MPFLWVSFHAAQSLAVQLSSSPAIKQSSNPAIKQSSNPGIEIVSDSRTADPARQVLIADGHVAAAYDQERVTAEHLEVHMAPDEMRAFATGNVLLTDPDGTVSAQNLEFSWNPKHRYAQAENVVVNMAGASLHARTAFVTPEVWTFTDFTFTNDRARVPLYQVSGRTLWIFPGRYARVYRPSISLFGHRVVTWPVSHFNLDPRARGLRPPTFEYRNGSVGLNWVAGFLIDKRTTLEWHADAFKHSWPGLGVQVSRSLVPAGSSLGLIVPRTELDQRFEFGYLESVLIRRPQSEPAFIERTRNTLSVLSDFNAAAAGRGADNETFSLPMGADYEVGGKVGSFGFLSDLRLETIRRMRDAVRTRGELETSIELPSLKFRPDLFTLGRLDAEAIQGDHAFGWGRFSAGLVYQPTHWLTFAGGAVGAVQGGTPDYDIDPLVYRNGLMFRTDCELGPRRLSLMARYDTRSGWFDKEFLFTQAMGPLEAFVIYREYPGDTRYGIALRIDQIAEVLKRRSLPRPDSGAGSNR